MTAHTIASKFRRALRNETGVTLTLDQLRELTSYGLLELIAQREIEELCPAKPALTGETLIGSTNAGMAVPRSGRSPSPEGGRSYIEALAR